MGDDSKKNININTQKNLLCSFCGKTQNEVKKLIAGPTVYICDECVELCTNIIKEELEEETETESFDQILKNPPNARELIEIVDQYVVKQEYAKKFLAVAITNHLWRIKIMKEQKNSTILA